MANKKGSPIKKAAWERLPFKARREYGEGNRAQTLNNWEVFIWVGLADIARRPEFRISLTVDYE